MDGNRPVAGRYWAFISYSHKDAVRGRRLHARLEHYALPRRLVGRITVRGTTPRRLSPIFRDREELPAAHDLSAEVRAALAASRALIVVCSPNAATSPWVAREVELFRALHPDRPILAALIAGEPAISLPSPLLDGPEPLAADFRANRDGNRLALLKLVAGLAGVGLDELIQRDALRRLRSVTGVTVAALIAVLTMGLLTALALGSRDEARRQKGVALEALDEARAQRALALTARDEAERQRSQAVRARDEAQRQRSAALAARAEAEDQRLEGEMMVEFMQTELRGKLTGSEQLAVQSAVSQRALDYYAGQKLDQMAPASMARRARVLTALGNDYKKTGDLDAAMKRFAESYRSTNRLTRLEPNNPRYVFDHAQNEFYVGDLGYARSDWKAAKDGYQRYNQLAERLIALKPDNLEYRKEVAYAQGSLCSVALKMRDTPAAMDYCTRSLATMDEVERRMADARRILSSDLANRHGWMADAHRRKGDIAQAQAERGKQEKILSALIAERPDDRNARADWIGLQQAYAALAHAEGDLTRARDRLDRVRPEALALVEGDPKDKRARKLLDQIDASIAFLKQTKGDKK